MIAGAAVFVVAFVASRFGCERLQEDRRAQAIQTTKANADQGKFLSSKEASALATNPRAFWKRGNNQEARLRGFEVSAISQLRKEIPDIKPLRTTEETLPYAERVRTEFQGTVGQPEVTVPVQGHQSAFVAESGVLYVVAMTDRASYKSPTSKFNEAMKIVDTLVETRLGDRPRDYFILPGWRKVSDAELRNAGTSESIGFVLESKTELSSVVMYSFSPRQVVDTINSIPEAETKQIINEVIDRAARER